LTLEGTGLYSLQSSWVIFTISLNGSLSLQPPLAGQRELGSHFRGGDWGPEEEKFMQSESLCSQPDLDWAPGCGGHQGVFTLKCALRDHNDCNRDGNQCSVQR
jgi:hypothetical protein